MIKKKNPRYVHVIIRKILKKINIEIYITETHKQQSDGRRYVTPTRITRHLPNSTIFVRPSSIIIIVINVKNVEILHLLYGT